MDTEGNHSTHWTSEDVEIYKEKFQEQKAVMRNVGFADEVGKTLRNGIHSSSLSYLELYTLKSK